MVKSHPLFAANQVLTHEHLNDAITFLDQEDRLTRTRLLGHGIVCGLEVRTDLSTKVLLGRGCGVTSAGDLLLVDGAGITYTHRRKYEEPGGYFSTRGLTFPVWELLEASQASSLPGTSLISSEPGFLADRIAVLYLEQQDKDLRSCVENDCNERGRRREFTQRLLVLTQDDANKLVLPDEATFKPPVDPATLRVLRPTFSDRVAPFGRLDYADVVSAFLNSVLSAEAPLTDALSKVITRLQPALGATPTQPNFADSLQRAREAAQRDPRGFQYLYDWFKDMSVAYSELVEVASLIGGTCCPDKTLFPLHLLLGRLENNLATGFRPSRVPPAPSIYRYPFLPSPAVGQQSELRDQAAALLQRLILLMEKYSWVPGTRIAITPDAGPRSPLERRAIPHYYSLTAGGPPSLLDHWSPYLTRHDWQRSAPSFASGQYSTLGTVLEPLRYDHDGAAFYRVEGHIEQRVDVVLDYLEGQRKTLGLPFKIVAVAFDDKVTDKQITKDCRSADLEAAYDELREEFRCAIEHERDFFEALMPPPPDRGRVKGQVHLNMEVPVAEQLYIKVLDTGEIFAADPQRNFELELPEGPYVLQAFTNDKVGDTIFLDVRPGGDTIQNLNINRPILTGISGSKAAQPPPAAVLPGSVAPTLSATSTPLSVENPIATKPPYRYEVPRKTIKEFIKDFVGVVPPKEAPDKLNLVDLSDVWTKAGKPDLVKEIGLPARVALLLGQTMTLLPGDLTELNLTTLQNNMKSLKDAATSLETQLLASKTALLPQQSRILQHVQVLKAFCYAEAMATLQTTLKDRQDQQKRQLLFSEFIAEHPALEHLGGVSRGGTFVIAYEDGVVKADFALPYLCCDPCGPMLLKIPDALPPPDDIYLTLPFTAPTKSIIVPEATGTKIVRSIVTNPGALASITVEELPGKIRIEGQQELFSLKEYSFEYLLQDNASNKTALGKVFLTLINDKPIPPPADLTIRTGSATAKLTIRPPAALPVDIVVTTASLADATLGAVTVEQAGEAIGFQPGTAFASATKAIITYLLRNTVSQQTVEGKVIVVLEQQVPAIVLPDVIVPVNPLLLQSLVIELPLADKPNVIVDRMDPLDSIYGSMRLKSARGPVFYTSRTGIKATSVTVGYSVKDTVTGAKGTGRIILRFIWTKPPIDDFPDRLPPSVPELTTRTETTSTIPTPAPVIQPPLTLDPVVRPMPVPIVAPAPTPIVSGPAPTPVIRTTLQPTATTAPTAPTVKEPLTPARARKPVPPPPPKRPATPPSKGPTPKKKGKR